MRKGYYLQFVLFGIVIFVLSQRATMAEERTPLNQRTPEFEEVVVSAGRIEEKKKEINANVTLIDKTAIDTSSAKDLGELLTENGVGFSKRYPGASNVIGIRGFQTDVFGDELQGHVLITVNGRRAGTGNVAKIMTKNIERIEIIRGPASVQYGSAAMGGIVNVITKRGTETTDLFVEGGLGSRGYDEKSAGFSGKIKVFDFAASFTSTTADEYQTGGRDTYYNTGYEEKTDFNVNAGISFLPRNRIGLIHNQFNADRVGLPGYLSRQDMDDYKDSGLDSTEINYEGATSDEQYVWQVRYFQTKDTEKNFDPVISDPSGSDDGLATESEDKQKGGQAQVSVNLEKTTLTLGSDWTHYDIESDYAPFRSEYDNPAIFIFGKYELIDQKLILSGGLRYDEIEVKVIDPAGNTESIDNISPRFGFAYLLSDTLKVRANYGEAFAFPSAKELAYDYTAHSTRYVGNPNLKPEKSQTGEIGTDYAENGIDASFTWFYTDFKDKIDRTPGQIPETTTWDNLGKATLQGIEGMFSYDLGIPLDLQYEIRPYVNFVYMITYEDQETSEELKEISDLDVSYGLTISDYEDFSATLKAVYTGEMTITDYEKGSPYRDIRKSGFTVVDLTITKRLMRIGEKGEISVKCEIENILDKEYAYSNGYPMPGRNFFIGIRYDFQSN